MISVEQFMSLTAGTLSLIVVALWLPAAVAAVRAGLPRRAVVGALMGAFVGAGGVVLAVPAAWEDWRLPAVLGATMTLAATAGPAATLWGLADVWPRLERGPDDADRPAETPAAPPA